jgi:transcriptional regulator with XRE-family HTH domain
MEIIAKENFMYIRVIKGFSIQGLARKMNVNASSVLNIEKGKPIRPETAKKACAALEEEFEQLFRIEVKKHE